MAEPKKKWDFNIFKKTPEKILEKMKAKEAKIEKIKEEINTMGKMIIKDGKLVDKDTLQPKVEQAQEVPQQAQQQPVQEGPTEEEIFQHQLMMQQQQQQMMAQRMQMQEEQQRMYAAQEQMEQEQLQQIRAQQMGQHPQQQLDAISIEIVLINGGVVVVETNVQELPGVIEQLDVAITTPTVFKYEAQGINGRNILVYNIR